MCGDGYIHGKSIRPQVHCLSQRFPLASAKAQPMGGLLFVDTFSKGLRKGKEKKGGFLLIYDSVFFPEACFFLPGCLVGFSVKTFRETKILF